MVEDNQLWVKIQAAQGAIVQNLSPKLQAVIENSIFHEVPGWFHIGFAYYIRPDAMIVERIRTRNPYSPEQDLANNIKSLQDVGFIDANNVITDEAFNAYQALIDAQDDLVGELDLMPVDELEAVADYLNRAYEAALKLDAPCLQDVSRYDLPDTVVHKIYYLIYRLSAWRDDAHLQAWKTLDVDGHTYEAFSLIWDGTATTAEGIAEARPFRGYEVADWQTTLDNLVDKAWLITDADKYIVTEDSKSMRDDVETKTDELFYQVFSGLSDSEIEKLLHLLQEIQENFSPESVAT